MKYSELIQFSPIESTIQLVQSNSSKQASENLVKTYVMSDKMAESLKAPVVDQLELGDGSADNKGVLIIGNYGTGKSHLMSVISAVANDADNLSKLTNKNFADYMKNVAGKYEVLRIEIGGVTMSLREIIFGFIADDFAERGINYALPDFSTVKDNKTLITDMMITFNEKYPDKGYLIVVDEFLSYLSSRTEQQIVLDLEFMRALGEMCSKSNLRVIFGVQEKIFDNPKFSFVSDTLIKVRDRFTQVSIKGEDTAYVVSERILKKTPEQKAWIRQHLEKFCNLYEGMSSKLEQFVELYPIHPSYIEVFNKLYLIENRHILKNISVVIKDIFNDDVPDNAPGIYSFDTYWPAIKSDGLAKTNPTVNKVVEVSTKLEDIIKHNFPKAAYKDLAIQIIYALSVHRLQNNDLSLKFGMTAETLKNDLCLYLPMPEQDSEFLLGVISTTLKDIMSTVSGQFLIHDEANNQYYIDVNKTVDFDEKISQRASLVSDDERNRSFYSIVYDCLEWEKKEYVTGFKIYEHDINWDSHNIFREGYLFMGLPGERSTAQPERDFYIHIMPPYDNGSAKIQNLDDEIYFYFKSSEEFKNSLSLYTAAMTLASMSEGSDKESYYNKAKLIEKKLKRELSDNVNTCFDVVYKKEKRQLIEILKGKYNKDNTFNEVIDLAASICFDDMFKEKYPEFPEMKVKITRRNMADTVKAGVDHFAGRKTQQSTAFLQSFGLLEGDTIRPVGSKYASYYIDMLKDLPEKGVINYSDIFEPYGFDWQIDKKFRTLSFFSCVVFLALVYDGKAEITLKDGSVLNAGNLDRVARMNVPDIAEFKYLSKPAQTSLTEIKKLFDILGINKNMLDNPNTQKDACEALCEKAKQICNTAVTYEIKLANSFSLWGEPLANESLFNRMKTACIELKEEFSNYSAKYNTFAKLSNYSHDEAKTNRIGTQVKLLSVINEYLGFRTDCSDVVSYVSQIENMNLGEAFKGKIESAKALFRETRDKIADGEKGDVSAQKVLSELDKVKAEYKNYYIDEHKKKRLGLDDTKRKGNLQQKRELSNLRKLSSIEILSGAKLTDFETALSSLKTCYELIPDDLDSTPVCPHCHFTLDDANAKNVKGQVDFLEDKLDSIVAEWTKTLLGTLRDDPTVVAQKEYLNAKQTKVIDDFIEVGKLPDTVDDFFVKSVEAMLKNYEPVIISVDDLVEKLEALPALDEAQFRAKINDIVDDYIKGKDTSTLRIVVKK